jgi:hypothetical protein
MFSNWPLQFAIVHLGFARARGICALWGREPTRAEHFCIMGPGAHASGGAFVQLEVGASVETKTSNEIEMPAADRNASLWEAYERPMTGL